MALKHPLPIFEILFDGPGLYPEKIPVATLASTLSAVQRLAEGEPILEEEEGVEQPETIEDDRSLRLLDIKRGSAVFRISSLRDRKRSIAFARSEDSLRNPMTSERTTTSSVQSNVSAQPRGH